MLLDPMRLLRFGIAASQIRRGGLGQMPSLLPKLSSNIPARLDSLRKNAVDFAERACNYARP